MKYAAAVHNIRRNGQSDIKPGEVFEVDEIEEFKRLEGLNAIREATAEEIKQYQALKTAGEIAARRVEGSKANLDDGGAKKAATETVDKKAAAKTAKANSKPAEGGDASKASTEAADDDI